MPFGKAKRTLDKAVPGINNLHSGLMSLYELGRNIEVLKEMARGNNWIPAKDISKRINNNYKTIDSLGAITEDTEYEIETHIKTMKEGVEDKDSSKVVSAMNQLDEVVTHRLFDEMARWARAPKVVGTGRTVTE